jgi:nucleotide-binding universal stress UspA family protein
MKARKNRSQNVVLEMNRKESLPPIALPGWRLRHILVPVDFSDSSHKAMHYAACFAKQFSSELMLLHVLVAVPPPPQMLIFEAESLSSKFHEDAARQLSEWRKEVASQATLKAVVRPGNAAYQEILAAAHECNTDLIVMGNHGRSGLARMFTGSTAERVVRNAPCPVLVVREREQEFIEGAEAYAHEQSGAV